VTEYGFCYRFQYVRFYVSERTAEYHVEQIRNKLGFHSRREIAAWVQTQETLPSGLDAEPSEFAELHPPTRYARSGEINIAFQIYGTGPLDLVLVPGWVSILVVSLPRNSISISCRGARVLAESNSRSRSPAFSGAPVQIREVWSGARDLNPGPHGPEI
jgi:hypothetical protein